MTDEAACGGGWLLTAGTRASRLYYAGLIRKRVRILREEDSMSVSRAGRQHGRVLGWIVTPRNAGEQTAR